MPIRTFLALSLLFGITALMTGTQALANPSDTVATIGANRITAQELETRSAKAVATADADYQSQLHQLQKRLERERQSYKERELNAMVDERVLELEAKARRTSASALMAAIKPAAVTDAQLHAFYDSNRAQIGQPFEAISPQIRQYLDGRNQDEAKRAYLDSLRTKYTASVQLSPLRESVATTGPVRGLPTAPVSIVVFSDFQCPFCQRYVKTLGDVMHKYPSEVRVIYRHLPLSNLHPQAEQAAAAAVCADAQGKFWEMHDALFADQNALGTAALKDTAKRLGLDVPAFDRCLETDSAAATVSADKQAADDLGLSGTPASFINGRYLNGAATIEQLSTLIDDELKRHVARQ